MRYWTLLTAAVLVGCLTIALLPSASAGDAPATAPPEQTATDAKATPAPQPTPVKAPEAPSVSPVTQAAVQGGVLTCASRINQVMTFLAKGAKSSAYLTLPNSQPDESLFSVSLALDGINETAYASASFAPTTNGKIAAVYDEVQYVAQPPMEVERTVFKGLKRRGMLGKDIIMLDGGSITVYLMPAGQGCIAIKKQVIQ